MLYKVESLISWLETNSKEINKQSDRTTADKKELCIVIVKIRINIMLKSLSVLTAEITPDTEIQNPSNQLQSPTTTHLSIHKKQINDFATSTVANQQQSLLVLHLNKNQYNGALETNCYEFSSLHQNTTNSSYHQQQQSPTQAAQQLQQLLQQQQHQQQQQEQQQQQQQQQTQTQHHALLQFQHQQLLLQHQHRQSNEQSISTANQSLFDETDMQQNFTSCFKHK